MKNYAKLNTIKTNKPILETVKVNNGVAVYTDTDQYIYTDMDLDDGLYSLKAMREGFTIKSDLPFEDFPEDNESGEKLASVKISLDDLKWVAKAMSSEHFRYYLNGICFDKDGHLVATDGHRLHTIKDIFYLQESFIVPKEAIKQAIKTKSKTITFELCQDRAVITCDDITIVSKYIDGNFPQWQRVIPDGVANGFYPGIDLKNPLAEMVKYLKATGDTKSYQCTLDKGTLSDPSEEQIYKINDLNPPQKAGFNAMYLKDMDLEGPCFQDDPCAPMRVNQGKYRAVVMPQRV